MNVALLADHAGFIGSLAEWFEQEWAPYYGKHGPGDARADLATRCNRERLPIGLIAVDGELVLGTAALDRDAGTGLEPSVVGLLVAPDSRGKGVASALIASAEGLARKLGYRELYTSTAILGESLRRRGWQEQLDVEFLNGEQGKVYRRELTKGP